MSALEPLLTVDNICKSYLKKDATVSVLRGTSFQGYPGQVIAVTGESGVGKSTLLQIIAGFFSPDNGKITYHFVSSEKHPTLPAAYIFQDFRLFPYLNAFDNVRIASLLCGEMPGVEQVNTALAEVDLLDRSHFFPAELSGGQQQRVAIARALISKSQIILADEPTGNLDDRTAEIIINLLCETSKRYNKLLIIATHDQRVIQKSDDVILLERGS